MTEMTLFFFEKCEEKLGKIYGSSHAVQKGIDIEEIEIHPRRLNAARSVNALNA